MIALLPDLDSRFERLYGYLNDDVTRRRASVGLALELAGASPMSAAARARLEASRPLVATGCWWSRTPTGRSSPGRCGCRTGWPRTCSATTRPTRCWARSDRRACCRTPPRWPTSWPARCRAGVRLVHVRERVPGTGAAVAVAALSRHRPATSLVVDLAGWRRGPDALAAC